MSRTPDQEPSRRRSSQALDAFAKRCRWQRLRRGKTYPEVGVEGTSLIPEGPDNCSACLIHCRDTRHLLDLEDRVVNVLQFPERALRTGDLQQPGVGLQG